MDKGGIDVKVNGVFDLYAAGFADGRRKVLDEITQWMLERFAGDDGTGHLTEVYEHIMNMKK